MLLKEYLIKFGLPIYKSGFMDCDINTDVYDDIINDNVFYGIIRNQRYNWNVQIYDYSQHLKAIEEMKLGLENYFESKIMEYNVLSKSGYYQFKENQTKNVLPQLWLIRLRPNPLGITSSSSYPKNSNLKPVTNSNTIPFLTLKKYE